MLDIPVYAKMKKSFGRVAAYSIILASIRIKSKMDYSSFFLIFELILIHIPGVVRTVKPFIQPSLSKGKLCKIVFLPRN